MILYGYRMNDYDNLLRLSQAELSCSQEELKKIIQFLEEKKEEHLASEKEFGQESIVLPIIVIGIVIGWRMNRILFLLPEQQIKEG